MKVLFIYNPQAGKMQIKNKLWDIINLFSRNKYDLSVYATQATHDAYNKIKKDGRRYELIVCSGGDGTLNETVNGLMTIDEDKRPPIGYIPAGSTNDYAYSLKLPKNMVMAAALAVNGQPQEYDLGMFNGRYFTYVAGFGAFTAVSYSTPQEVKNLLGHTAYVFSGIKSLTSIKSYKLRLYFNDLLIEGRFVYGMVTNSHSVGGLYNIKSSDIKFDDGMSELLLVKEPKNLLELASITSYLSGIEKDSPHVITSKISALRIESDEEIPWTLDGEYGGSHKEVNITIVNKAYKMINNSH